MIDHDLTEWNDRPELGSIALLEAALETACHALLHEDLIPALEQEWLPAWRLPSNGPGWVRYWVLGAASGLREAIQAYRHALSLENSHQMRLLPGLDPDRPF